MWLFKSMWDKHYPHGDKLMTMSTRYYMLFFKSLFWKGIGWKITVPISDLYGVVERWDGMCYEKEGLINY